MIQTLKTLFLSVLLIPSAVSFASTVEEFRLPGPDQKTFTFAPGESEFTVVCFLGTECPLANLYASRLLRLSHEFPGVRFIGINSNRQDSSDEVAAYAKRHKLTFPVLKDHRNQVADQFGAKRTPEVFVLNKEFAVCYRGRIDDQYIPGSTKPKATNQHLKTALQELVAGQDPSVPSTEAVGCVIGRVTVPVTSSDVTYTKQIARVLQRHCIECHRAGEIGPFQLEDYDEVVGWGETMIEVIDAGRMPPWHANPKHGMFVNARNMPEEDKLALRMWVDAGMPYGDADDLPPPANHTKGWRLPSKPDQVVSMGKKPFEIPADGSVEYQYFVVDPGFEQDKWVTGAQIIPGNPSVVHHSIVFIRPPDGARFRGLGWLAAYVPGSLGGVYPKGSAIFVPAKSKLVFQQHYTPNGSEQTDMTKVAMTFGDDNAISHEIYTLVGIDQEFEIPPNEANHTIQSSVPYLPEHAELLSVMPHMHLRGKSFRLYAKANDERSILLDVPNYDFNWQHAYQFVEPIKLSSIDGLEFDMAFDNSAENAVNPNPAEHVMWGDQTWEEMAVAFFEVIEPRERPVENSRTESKQAKNEIPAEIKAKMAAEADRIIGKFDSNGDGLVGRHETSIAFRRVFGEIDRDNDGKLNREEIEQAARYRVD